MTTELILIYAFVCLYDTSTCTGICHALEVNKSVKVDIFTFSVMTAQTCNLKQVMQTSLLQRRGIPLLSIRLCPVVMNIHAFSAFACFEVIKESIWVCFSRLSALHLSRENMTKYEYEFMHGIPFSTFFHKLSEKAYIEKSPAKSFSKVWK